MLLANLSRSLVIMAKSPWPSTGLGQSEVAVSRIRYPARARTKRGFLNLAALVFRNLTKVTYRPKVYDMTNTAISNTMPEATCVRPAMMSVVMCMRMCR
jgi:hypothetical protein